MDNIGHWLPGHEINDQCVEFKPNPEHSQGYVWNDAPCAQEKQAICEM